MVKLSEKINPTTEKLRIIAGFNGYQKLALSLAIVIFILSLIIKLGFVTSYNFNIRGVEPNVLFSIQEIMDGDSLYPNPEKVPYAITQYMPLYYILVAKLSNLLEIIPGEQFNGIYIVGRTISLGLSLGISVAIFIACRKYGAGFFISGIGSLAAFVLPIPWYSLLRPDALMAFFGIASVVLYSLYLQEKIAVPPNRLLMLIGFLGYLSFLSKQNGAIFMAVILFFSAARLKGKEFITLSGGLLLGLLITTFIFLPYYNILPMAGNFFYDHIIGGLNNGINVRLAYTKLYSIYFSWYLPLVAVPFAGLLLVGFSIKKKGIKNIDESVLFLACEFSVITAFAIITGIKDGSAINYMNESMLLAILFIVRLFHVDKTSSIINQNLSLKVVSISYIFLFLFVLLTQQYVTYQSNFNIKNLIAGDKPITDAELITFFQNRLSNHPEDLIYSPDYLIANIFFENIVFPHQSISNSSFRRGVLNYSEVTDLLEAGTLRFIVLSKNTHPLIYLYANSVDKFELIQSTTKYDIYINPLK